MKTGYVIKIQSLLIVLLIAACQLSTAQEKLLTESKLVEPGKQWVFQIASGEPPWEVTHDMCYEIENDTIIANENYKKLLLTQNCTQTQEIRGFIRETDNGKVFFLSNDIHPEKEYLLYDFGMQVGDTTFYEYEQTTYYYALDSTGTNEDDRKLFYISESTGRREIWIEGVGATIGLLNETMTGGSQTFTCCILNNELLYQNGYGSCFFEENDSLTVFSQPFWSIAEDDTSYNKSHVTDIALFQDSIILVGGIVNDASCSYHNLFAYNFKGQKLWNIQRACDVIATDTNYIYTAGYDIGADDAIGDEHLILSKYDKKGNEIFSIGYPEVPHNYFEFKPQNMDVAGDGTVLISFGKLVFKSDINGTKIQEYQLTALADVKGIFSLDRLTYLIYSQNQIYKSDSSFVLTDSISFSGSINKVLLENDTVYALLDNNLVRLDASLNTIDTLMHFSAEASDMEFYDDNLWVQINEPDSIKLLHVKSSNIAETFSFEKLSEVKGFIATKNRFTFIGNSFTDQIGLYNYKASDLTGTALHLPDIELVDFNIDSISLVYTAVLDEELVLTGFRFNTELTVKNNGQDTIHSFSVFSYLKGNDNCAQNYLYQKFTGLEILPDQTQTVKLKRAYQEGVNNNQLCFECLAPNSKLEKQTANNSLCKTFTITGIENRVQSAVKVFPNPFADYLTIEDASLKITYIQIMDMNGKILLNKAPTGQRTTIETSNLHPGPYILKIYSTGKGDAQLIIKK